MKKKTKCGYCNGKGREHGDSFRFITRKCSHCNGTGYSENNKTKCWMCKGKGRSGTDLTGSQCLNCKGTGYAEPKFQEFSTLENPLDKLDGLQKSIPTSSGKQNKEIMNKNIRVIGNGMTVDFTDLYNTIKDLEKNHGNITLADKIKQYLEIKDIGQVIVDGCDLILRLRMGQYRVANTIINKYIKSKKKVKNNMFHNEEFDLPLKYLCERIKIEPLNIEEPLYKGIEFGEYVKCYQTNRMCKYVKDCWPTRKGFAKCRENERNNGK